MSDIYTYIGNRIRIIREAAGLSQGDIAQRIGTHANTVSRWEAGKYKPDFSDLQAIGNATGASLRHFLPDESMSPAEQLQQAAFGLDEQGVERLIEFAGYLHWRRRGDAGEGGENGE